MNNELVLLARYRLYASFNHQPQRSPGRSETDGSGYSYPTPLGSSFTEAARARAIESDDLSTRGYRLRRRGGDLIQRVTGGLGSRPQSRCWLRDRSLRLNVKLVESGVYAVARYTPPDWGDPPPCCVNEHAWQPPQAHPNGVNDVRGCKNTYIDAAAWRECPFSDWREHRHWRGAPTIADRRACRVPGSAAIEAEWL